MRWIFRYLRTAGDNFHEVVPGRIYRSATPSPENLERWHRKYGVRTWLDLRLPEDCDGDRARNYAAQLGVCRRLGIERIWVPISDRTPTSDLDVQRCLDTLTDLSKSAVLVACQGGRHRTGLAIALYRVRVQNWKARDAFKEAGKRGFYDAMHVDFGRHFRKLLGLLLVLLMMAVPAFGQHPFIKPQMTAVVKESLTTEPTIKAPPIDYGGNHRFDRSFWVASGIYASAVAADFYTTDKALERGGREGNPLFAVNGGRGVRYAANALVSAGIWGAAAYADRQGHGKAARILLYVAAAIRLTAAVWNHSRRR